MEFAASNMDHDCPRHRNYHRNAKSFNLYLFDIIELDIQRLTWDIDGPTLYRETTREFVKLEIIEGPEIINYYQKEKEYFK